MKLEDVKVGGKYMWNGTDPNKFHFGAGIVSVVGHDGPDSSWTKEWGGETFEIENEDGRIFSSFPEDLSPIEEGD